MKRHVETVHEGKRPVKCPHCEATFPEKSGKRGLERHIQNIHQSNKITDKARAYVKNIFNLNPVTDGTKGEFMERIMKITDILIHIRKLFVLFYFFQFVDAYEYDD